MKIKHIKIYSFGLVLCFSLIGSLFATTSPAHADNADTYCSAYKDKSAAFIAMCERQYRYGQEGKNDSCNYAATSEYAPVCSSAYAAGKSGATSVNPPANNSTSTVDTCELKSLQTAKDACHAGNAGSLCTEYTGGDKAACLQGVQNKICGSPDATSSANAIDARQACYTKAKDCVSNPTANVEQCLKDINGSIASAISEFMAEVKRKNGDAGTCGKAKTNVINCSGFQECSSEGGIGCIGAVLKIVILVLTIIIGIVATGGIVYAAILYASAEDNAGQVSKAKGMIRDVAIGLFLYGFMAAILNWLVPGGIIG